MGKTNDSKCVSSCSDKERDSDVSAVAITRARLAPISSSSSSSYGKMQSTESFPHQKMMVMPSHIYDDDEDDANVDGDVNVDVDVDIDVDVDVDVDGVSSFSEMSKSSSGSGCGGCYGGGISVCGGSGGGPIFCNTSNQVGLGVGVACMTPHPRSHPHPLTYDVVGANVVSGRPQSHRTLYPPHPFNTSDTSSFKSSVPAGGAMVGSAGRVSPFTSAQWQEFERQAMIYKYMMASAPVPPQLLIPISYSDSPIQSTHTRHGNSSDPEPWRCRRTDGKKWRCSRDVAPDQKYCERHTHKGRPRSRKHVEPHHNFDDINTVTTHNNSLSSSSSSSSTVSNMSPTMQYHHQFPSSFVSSAAPKELSRCLEWSLKSQQNASMVSPSSNHHHQQQWHQLTHSKVLNSFPEQQLLSRRLIGLERQLQEAEECRRHFIDAWSAAERQDININANCSLPPTKGKIPMSSLTLLVSGGTDEECEEQPQMGIENNLYSERGNEGIARSSQQLNWMSPASWMGWPPGGPLAEALCLGVAGTDGSSTPTTTRSSYAVADGNQTLNLI